MYYATATLHNEFISLFLPTTLLEVLFVVGGPKYDWIKLITAFVSKKNAKYVGIRLCNLSHGFQID